MTELTAAERRKAKLRLHIIAQATALYQKNGRENGGFEKTTVEEIAERSDISLRTFFRYFESKMDVIYLDIDSAKSDLARFIRQRPHDEDRLVAAINGHLEQVDFFINQKENRRRLLRSLAAPQFQDRLLVLRNELKSCIIETLTEPSDRGGALNADHARIYATLIVDVIGDILDDWSKDTDIDVRTRSLELFSSLPDLAKRLKRASAA
ncbi:MAG: hypothetical protein M2R45_04927 [Verrucomicrobia subdivision 3 bacterium]|nr:hypothetical protein [Limisphaerales bacterium]